MHNGKFRTRLSTAGGYSGFTTCDEDRRESSDDDNTSISSGGRCAKRRIRSYRSLASVQKEIKEPSEMYRGFLDVDVMKAVADLNSKPKFRTLALKRGFIRVIGSPLYPTFWKGIHNQHTLYSILYVLQLTVSIIFLIQKDQQEWKDVHATEIHSPALMLLFVAVIFGRLPMPGKPHTVKENGMSGSIEKLTGNASNASNESRSDSEDEDEEADNFVEYSDFDDTHKQRPNLMTRSSSVASLDIEQQSYAEDDVVGGGRIDVLLWWNFDGKMKVTKLPMPVLEIRNAIHANVEGAARKLGDSKHITHIAAFIFACMPTVHRVLTNSSLSTLTTQFSYQTPESGHINLTCSSFSDSLLSANCRDVLIIDGVDSFNSYSTTVVMFLNRLAGVFLHPSASTDIPLQSSLMVLVAVIVTSCSVYLLVKAVIAYLINAHRSYQKRYLYAKYFSALTSLRRSRRYSLPHFRLKNVENVRAWLSLRGSRAWLRLEASEVAADMVVSMTFQFFLFVVAAIGWIVLQEGSASGRGSKKKVSVNDFDQLIHAQIFCAAIIVSYYLLQFMMIGTSINHKYGNSTLLLTEQVCILFISFLTKAKKKTSYKTKKLSQLNIHLRMVAVTDRSSHNDPRIKVKKEKLVLTNKVLELAAKLLKELEAPNKVC